MDQPYPRKCIKCPYIEEAYSIRLANIGHSQYNDRTNEEYQRVEYVWNKLAHDAHEEHMVLWNWISENHPAVLTQATKELNFNTHEYRMLRYYIPKRDVQWALQDVYNRSLTEGAAWAVQEIIKTLQLHPIDDQ
jgi:hypothetical protein